nr:hypothetical protein [Tanacetum cinerariifolium]
MIDQGVTAALAARDALKSTNGDDSHNSGTGVRRTERATRECNYIDFLKCQPLPFKGTEGVASLSQCNYAAKNQVKFATCTLHSVALTWWNTHVQTVGHEAAYGMTWKMLMKMMTEKYCPRNEIRKLEMKLWDLKVNGTDLAIYTQRFQELALLCGRMFSEEADKIEKYVRGLPDMIHGSVVASNPKTMQEAIEITTELMDKKIRTFAERQKSGCYECGIQGHFKRECPKLKNNNNQGNQSGRNNVPARVYAVGRAGKDPDANVVMGVTADLAARDALRSTNGDDSYNSETGVRRTERATRECTYTDFLKCQPLPFKGTKGVASLSQWCERMESVFHISNCAAENQTVGHEAAYGMSWKTLMKMMTDKYCPQNENRKLEMELWELKVKGTDLASYTQRFQELALLCERMFSEKADKIEKYVGGL